MLDWQERLVALLRQEGLHQEARGGRGKAAQGMANDVVCTEACCGKSSVVAEGGARRQGLSGGNFILCLVGRVAG